MPPRPTGARPAPALLLLLSARRLAGALAQERLEAWPDSCDAAPDSCEAAPDESAVSLLQRRRSQQATAPVPEIGVLNLFGYYYPTQPGDVNDIRSFCHVDPAEVDKPYPRCAQPLAPGHFGVSFASLGEADRDAFTFAVAKKPAQSSRDLALWPGIKAALRHFFRKPEVKGVTCNFGFCAALQPLALEATQALVLEEKFTPKPLLFSGLSFLPLFTSPNSKLSLDLDTQAIIVLTSFFPALTMDNVFAMMEDAGDRVGVYDNITLGEVNQRLNTLFGISCMEESLACSSVMTAYRAMNMTEVARSVIVIGWNDQEGYVPVDASGGFHNVNLTLETYAPRVRNAFAYARDVLRKEPRVILLESTEMPAHANKIRMDFKVPVYDISSVAKCVMAAAPSFARGQRQGVATDVFEDLFKNDDFQFCAEDLFDPKFVEPLFGTQADGILKFYEGIEGDELTYLTCNGGRSSNPFAPLARKIELYDQGFPYKVGDLRPVCLRTDVGRCVGVPADGVGCPDLIPGSGNCGGGGYGPQLNPRVLGAGFPCGADGHLCASFEDVPALNSNFTADPRNANACPMPSAAQGFVFGGFSSALGLPR